MTLTKKQKAKIEKLAKDSIAEKLVKGKIVYKMTAAQVEESINNLCDAERDYYDIITIGANN